MIPSTDGHEEERKRPEIVAWRNNNLRAINKARSKGIVSKDCKGVSADCK